MNTVKNVEKAGRQVWLAGLGAVLLGKEYAVKKLDEMFEGTNSLVNQVVTKGQEIEGDLKDKLSGSNPVSRSFLQDEKIAELREKLGLNQESKQDKISRLAAKVDALTDIVATISVKAEEEKAAAEKKAVVSAKTETKEAAPKPAVTTTAKKSTATRKPRATASKTAETASKTDVSDTAAKKPATTRTRTRKATTAKTTAAKSTTTKTTAAKATDAKATGSAQSKTDKE